MTSTKLSFIKKGFESVDAAKTYSSTAGRIVFDETHKVICVNGNVYGGNVTDVNYANNVLTITKADGTTQTLDFTDIASAKSMMAIFEQIEGIIGAPVISSGTDKGKPDYTGAHYISAQKNLIQADLTLDAAIWGVQGKAEAAQGYAETVQGNLQTTETRLQGYIHDVQGNLENVNTNLSNDISNLNTYAQGVQSSLENTKSTLQGYIHGVQGNLEYVNTTLTTKVEAAQGYAESIATDLEATQGALETHTDDSTGGYKHWADHIGVQGVQYKSTSLGSNALEVMQGLASQMESIVDQSKSYTMVKNATADEGYFATYQMQEVVGNTTTNVGVPINIPKDFLVKSAEIKTVTTQGQPYAEAEVGDKYIDFVINVKSGTATDEHLYLPVNELVDAYTVSDTATIDLEMSNNNITATLKDGSVQGVHIANGAVDTQHIADNAVQTAKINDGAVTSGKIADGAVSSSKIAANAVTSVQMADGVVTSAKIAANAVTSVQMADGAVTSAKIAENAVTSTQLATDAVTSGKIADGAVTSGKIANGAVNSVQMADGAVTSAKIGAGAVQSAQLGNNAVNSQHIANNAVQTAALQDGSVTKAKLAADALTTVQDYAASIQVNSAGQPYTLAKVNDTAITATVELYWEEWS